MPMPRLPALPNLPGIVGKVAAELTAPNKEKARALPSSKGGETPQQLQTYRTEIFTFFTEPGIQTTLYSAENWVRMKLTLQTAGPVAVGTRAELLPILSGKGVLLDTNVEYKVYLAKGTRFYIASGAVNRVTVTVEPIPLLEQLSGEIRAIGAAIGSAAGSIVGGVVGGLASGLRGAGAAAAAKLGATPPAAPPPVPRMPFGAPKLTPLTRTR